MIKRLENAGLGFYVRESDTQQKLGTIMHTLLQTLDDLINQNNGCHKIAMQLLSILYNIYSTHRQDPSTSVGIPCS